MMNEMIYLWDIHICHACILNNNMYFLKIKIAESLKDIFFEDVFFWLIKIQNAKWPNPIPAKS